MPCTMFLLNIVALALKFNFRMKVAMSKSQKEFEKQQQENPEPVDMHGIAGHNEIKKPKKDTLIS